MYITRLWHNYCSTINKLKPIHDISHAQNALAEVSQHGTLTEKTTVRKKVYAKYPQLKKKKKG